jgi:hypothetical protein
LRTVSEMSMDMETKIRGNTYLRRAAYIFYRGRGWVGVYTLFFILPFGNPFGAELC